MDIIETENRPAEQFASALLAALAGEGAGLQRIVDLGSKRLGNPIIVTDRSWKAIAMTSDAEVPDDSDWHEFRKRGLLPTDAVVSGIRDSLAERIDRSGAPFRWQGQGMAYPRVFKRLVVGGRTAATLSVVEYGRPFTEEDGGLLELLADAVSAELQKNQFQQYSRGMLYEEFIWNLLEGRLTDPKAIEERVKLLNLGLKKNIYVFVFDVREYDAGQYSASYLRDLLEQMISGGRAIVYNDHIVITASFSRARDIFRTELKNLGAFLKEYNIRCGISRRCTEPSELRFYYEQALDAMAVGTHMDGDRYIYAYGEYAVYHVAAACRAAGGQNTLDVRKFCHPGLLALLAYDREYQTHFTDSLGAYLRAFKNITNAANELHLHRNTMVYHLKRIAEIMDLSLDNYNSLQQIELSFRLLEYDKKLNRHEKWDEIPESDR
jgi:sugar diacid utilization regulator